MPSVDHATCPLCEAICGITVEHEDGRILGIRGDDDDPFSRGYICPKGVALQDIQADPDRLRRPIRRTAGGWEEIGWDEALGEASERLAAIRDRHGPDAIAVFVGNPAGHSYSAALYTLPLLGVLKTRNLYSANSVDALPRLITSSLVFGTQAAIPIPDLDRTQLLLVVGANPLVSNGSVMTAPDCKRRLAELRARGGKLVVIDPRRTETAAVADAHHFIRPGTDALLLAALVRTVLEERLLDVAALRPHLDGLERLPGLVEAFSPEAVEPAVGIAAAEIRGLARAFAASPSAVCYGRMGTTTQEFGTISTWLIDVLNTLTGNLDRPGGAMFPTPAVDLAGLAAAVGQAGSFDRWRSRVRGLPEFNGELPAVGLADEIETPGPGQVRALITQAGNPVLSLPNGRRLDRAFEGLEYMVSIDIYRNETTRHAHLVLPPTFGLEHDHYPLLFHALAVRNTVKYSLPVVPAPPGALHDWEILLELATGVLRRRGVLEGLGAGALGWLGRRLGPRGLLSLLVRFGPHGKGVLPWGSGLTLDEVEREPHGRDLGALEPRLQALLRTPDRRVHLAPPPIVADLGRLEARLAALRAARGGGGDELLLIGRRHLRSNNSWMHNSLRLVRGRNRCTLMMHPDDAARRALVDRARVEIRSRVGAIDAELELTREVMPGVVSFPHGWGHDRAGAQLGVAGQHAGASMNDVTDDTLVDAISGTASLSGIPVTVKVSGEAGGGDRVPQVRVRG